MLSKRLPINDLPPENCTSYNVVKKGEKMVKKGYRPEQIINKLREA